MEFPDVPDFSDELAEKGIFLNFEDVEFDILDEQHIIRWLENTALSEKKDLSTVNYVFCSDEYLLNVNREYLQHDYYTDVITFPYSEEGIEGDIYISIDRVKDNAHSLGIDTAKELYRVMVHGFLHLAGYGDQTPAEKKLMTEKEDFYLQIFFQQHG